MNLIDRLKCFFGFHKWEYYTIEGIFNKYKYRRCTICGKIQVEVIKEIGQDEYSYLEIEWEEMKE